MSETRKSTMDLFYRHREDPKFHAVVEMLVAIMLNDKIAPDELRDAAFVASIKYMHLRPVRDLVYVRDDLPQDFLSEFKS